MKKHPTLEMVLIRQVLLRLAGINQGTKQQKERPGCYDKRGAEREAITICSF